MRATGITRCIDELGRIVIPMEMRRNLHLANGDAMEFLISEDGNITLRKFEMQDTNLCAKCQKETKK